VEVEGRLQHLEHLLEQGVLVGAVLVVVLVQMELLDLPI